MPTDWLTAAAMLLCGIVVGFMFVYGMKRRSFAGDIEHDDREAKRDALARELRDLQDRGGNKVERARLERELDALGAPAPSPLRAAEGRRDAGPHTQHAALRGFLYGALSVAILASIGWFVWRSTSQRPDDIQSHDDLAKSALDREDFPEVARQTQYVLQRSPNDARALTYQALVRIAMGQNDAAAQMLSRATQSDPNLLDAAVAMAWVRAQAGDSAGAEAAIAEAKRRHPEQAARLDELRARIHPSQPIHVELKLGHGARLPAGGVIFITARNEGVTTGPPVAVKRLPIGAFPMTVDITSADSMMGQQLPPRVRIEARVNSSGDPLTKSPEDLSAAQDGVALGSTASLTLR
jgi:tetratricopeptide (TPR) repeat protein